MRDFWSVAKVVRNKHIKYFPIIKRFTDFSWHVVWDYQLRAWRFLVLHLSLFMFPKSKCRSCNFPLPLVWHVGCLHLYIRVFEFLDNFLLPLIISFNLWVYLLLPSREYLPEWLLFFERNFHSPTWTSPFPSTFNSLRYPIYRKFFYIFSISFIIVNMSDSPISLSNHSRSDDSPSLVREWVFSSPNPSHLVIDKSVNEVIYIYNWGFWFRDVF